MSASKARAIAFDILRRVEAEGAYASDLLYAELAQPSDRARSGVTARKSTREIKREDAALATELTLGVLRWQRFLDFLIDRQLKKPIAKLDLSVALALRLGLYQLRFLERVPPRAAVNESVELVKRARKASAASLVNAVLRRAAEDATLLVSAPGKQRSTKSSPLVGEVLGPARPEKPVAGVPSEDRFAVLPYAERLAILHSHPTWLVERWLTRFGQQRTLALVDANNRPPRLACTLQDVEHRGHIIASLAKSGLHVETGALLKNAFAVSGGSVTHTDAFLRGAISIQDEASQAIPPLLGVQPGNRVLDLCAAPGGKTPPLIRAAGPGGFVIAADHHAHRLRAMRAQFDRLNISSGFCNGDLQGQPRVAIVELDAEQPLPFRAQFDRILVDAPCSGTGTLARHPEIRWRLEAGQLAEFHRLQVRILTSALAVLAPGGRLVYSTCSLEPEENEDVIAEVLRRSHGNPSEQAPRLVPQNCLADEMSPHLAPGIDAASLFDPSGYFRTIPGARPTDGFFAAVLEKPH